jgi:hypothetical protein
MRSLKYGRHVELEAQAVDAAVRALPVAGFESARSIPNSIVANAAIDAPICPTFFSMSAKLAFVPDDESEADR